MSVRKKIFHSDYIWQTVYVYFGLRTLFDLFRIQVDPFSGQLLMNPGVSLLVILDILILFLFITQTKIGFFLVEIFFLLLTIVGFNQYYTLRGLAFTLQENDLSEPVAIKLALFRIILFVCIHSLFFVLLIVNKNSQIRFKKARWVIPNFFNKHD